MSVILLDTGPLFAYLSKTDVHHDWAVTQFGSFGGPLLSCEPVLAEAAYLISRRGGQLDALWAFLRRGIIRISYQLESDFEGVAVLMQRYSRVPMDLADACLVRLSEQHRDCQLITTDSDFRFYRRFGRQVIPLVFPD
jgi:predicted nucleic acid-binding protein